MFEEARDGYRGSDQKDEPEPTELWIGRVEKGKTSGRI